MEGLVRVAAVSSRQHTANPTANLSSILDICMQLAGADIVLLPQLVLSGPYCGSLFSWKNLLLECNNCLEEFCHTTKNTKAYYILGLPVEGSGGACSAAAVVHSGKLLGLIPALGSSPSGLNSCGQGDMLPHNTLFDCGGIGFCVLPCNPQELPKYMHLVEDTGCSLVLVPSALEAKAGGLDRVHRSLETVSECWDCAVAVASSGPGASSSPLIYGGITGIYERGRRVSFSASLYEPLKAVYDLDPFILNKTFSAEPIYSTNPALRKDLIRIADPYPFTSNFDKPRLYSEIFELQAASIALRLKNTGMENLVLGLSGGLDSTLAALAGVHALDVLGLPRENMLCVIMPGFGTGSQTKNSANRLAEILGVGKREIPISGAAAQHLKDIGHDGRQDVTYENAQARERCQILFDISNMYKGLVLGTGDLSEEALGWSTFGGDHLAGFNVNTCLTKTMIRGIVEQIAQSDMFAGARDVLMEVLGTPVSPELLPPDSKGNISQKTEDILGPYELHEFFLYYLIRYKMPPKRILEYACISFGQRLSKAFIEEKLRLFLNKFTAGQFKRSCAPDAAAIFSPNLLAGEFEMPSDLEYGLLSRSLDMP